MRTSCPPPSITSVISMARPARSSRTERRCAAGGLSSEYPSCSALQARSRRLGRTDLPCPRLPRPHERPALLRTGRAPRSPRCYARWSSGSRTATPARRGSSTCPGRRGCPRLRSGPRPTARQRARARRWRGTRAVRRRSGTISPARKPRPFGECVFPRPGTGTGARPAGRRRAVSRRREPGRARCPASGVTSGHQASGPKSPAAERQQGRPPVVRRSIKQHHAPLVGVALPGRPQPSVDERGHAVGHRAQQPPAVIADRRSGGGGLQRREDTQLEDEAVVVRGELAVDARRERVVAQRLLQPRGRTGAATGRFRRTTGTRRMPRADRPPRR